MSEAIRVLHVVHGMDCGGAENMIMNIYRAIDRNKVQFDFLVHTSKKCFFDEEIISLGGRIYTTMYFNGINRGKYQRTVKKLFEQHREWKVVHGHLGSCAHIYLKEARKLGKFTIAHSHNTNPTDFTVKNLMYLCYSLKTRKVADYYIGCSYKAGVDRFGENITKSGKFMVLNNAIDTDKFLYDKNVRNCVRKEFKLENAFVVGHVGRFNYQKNHMYLLKVFKKVLEEKENAVLVLVGDGDLKKNIVNEAKKLGINDKIIFTGIRRDVNRLLQAFDCFVFPSFYEGLPVTVIEAQASGVKCVISKNITSEVGITDLVRFVSIEEDDLNEWKKEICSQYTRIDRKNDIIKAGYDIGETVKWIENLYCRKGEL